MVIPARNPLFRVIMLLLGISPLWTFAGEPRSYGPVGPTDTLAQIAIHLKGDGVWHYQRWMYGLYQKNPQAFFGANMNNLKLGATLIVPSDEELGQIEQAEAFRAVKVHLYVLEQERQEDRESTEDLLLRARMQRLFVSNEMMQKESGELFERISSLEQQVGSVVDQVLETDGRERQSRSASNGAEGRDKRDHPEPKQHSVANTEVENESENSIVWWSVLLIVVSVYGAGFEWRRRVEASL